MRDPEVQALLDKQAIYEVICRFARGADRVDRELILSCFHRDALYHYAGYDGTIEGGLKSSEGWLETLDGTMSSNFGSRSN